MLTLCSWSAILVLWNRVNTTAPKGEQFRIRFLWTEVVPETACHHIRPASLWNRALPQRTAHSNYVQQRSSKCHNEVLGRHTPSNTEETFHNACPHIAVKHFSRQNLWLISILWILLIYLLRIISSCLLPWRFDRSLMTKRWPRDDQKSVFLACYSTILLFWLSLIS